MSKPRASEELLAAPLPELIQEMGLSVANANLKLRESEMIYTIDEAEIELKVAISIGEDITKSGKLEFGIQAFAVNASYSKTYGFKEEASSSIKLKLKAVPKSSVKKTTVKKKLVAKAITS